MERKEGNKVAKSAMDFSGADLGGGCRGCAPPPPEMTCGFLIQLVFCKKKTMWFIGVEVEQETSAPPPKKNPGSAPVFPQNVSRFFVVTWQDWSEFLLRYLCKDLFFLNWLLANVTYQKVTCKNMFLLFLFSELLIPIILDLLFTLLQFQGTNPKLSI